MHCWQSSPLFSYFQVFEYQLFRCLPVLIAFLARGGELGKEKEGPHFPFPSPSFIVIRARLALGTSPGYFILHMPNFI